MKKNKHLYKPKWNSNSFSNQKKRKRKKKIFLWFILVIILLGIGVVSFQLFFPAGNNETTEKYVYILPNTTTQEMYESVSAQLKKEIGLRNKQTFIFYGRFWGLSRRYRPGRYAVNGKMSNIEIIQHLISSPQAPVRVTFSSIRTQEQLAEVLTKKLALSKEDFLEYLRSPINCNRLGFDTISIRTVFIPDTYDFFWTATAEQITKKCLTNYYSFWNKSRRKKAELIGFSPTEIAIIASIVEEESNKTDEYARIAGLYINRLHRQMPLQADPTVKYALQDFSLKRILTRHTTVKSPYNTYFVTGLPPGIIRYPQTSTLEKVLNYERHNFIYMCAKEDFSGYHNFASNYTEHLKNAYRYQKNLDEMKIQ